MSLVRPARFGIPAAVDAHGRTLASMDEAAAEQLVLVAQVPINGVRTLYARIGDLFAWLCVAGGWFVGGNCCGGLLVLAVSFCQLPLRCEVR